MALAIAHVSSEMAPLAKVGGLGDVVGGAGARTGAPRASRAGRPAPLSRPDRAGRLVPARSGRHARALGARPGDGDVHAGREPGRGPAGTARRPRGRAALLRQAGSLRRSAHGRGLSRQRRAVPVLLSCGARGAQGARRAVRHPARPRPAGCWAPCFVRTHDAEEPAFDGMATVFTIHNLGYQGIHDAWMLGLAGFWRELFYPPSPFEYWGRVNYMKVGLTFADLISTVSPTYAREIQTTGEYGFGLEGVLRRRTRGRARHPERDRRPGLGSRTRCASCPRTTTATHLEGKDACRRALLRAAGSRSTTTARSSASSRVSPSRRVWT